jgi:hypothetical protein
MMWVKQTTAGGTFLYKSDLNGSKGWWISVISGPKVELKIVRATNFTADTTVGLPANGTWFLVAVTWDGGFAANSAKIYINGVDQTGSVALGAAGSNPDDTESLMVGNGANGSPGFFNGSMDNLRIYRRTLTPQEILAYYNATK